MGSHEVFFYGDFNNQIRLQGLFITTSVKRPTVPCMLFDDICREIQLK